MPDVIAFDYSPGAGAPSSERQAVVAVSVSRATRSSAPIAYWNERLEVRLFDGRLYRRYPHPTQTLGSDDFDAAAVVGPWIDAARKMHGGTLRSDLLAGARHAARQVLVVEGEFWIECGEPVYRLNLLRSAPRIAYGELEILRPVGKYIHDDLFPADQFTTAQSTLEEWLSRGFAPAQALEPWTPVHVSGVDAPGTRWGSSGILAMPDPVLLTRPQLIRRLAILRLRLSLAGALPGYEDTLSLESYDPEYLSSAQEEVVLTYIEVARLRGLSPNAPLPFD